MWGRTARRPIKKTTPYNSNDENSIAMGQKIQELGQ
jgi:hypothetical protein